MIQSTDELGVIFDWDGVIVDSHDLHERSWQILADDLGKPLPNGFFQATFGIRNQQIIPEFTTWARPDEAERIAELAHRKESLYRELIRREGIQMFPGVMELLDSLATAGIPVAIGSSAPRENLRTALAELELRSQFVSVTAAEDVTNGKPDPDVFLRCAREMGRAADRCVVLEDAPAGIRAAREARMKVIAVSTTHSAAALGEADLVVRNLTQVGIETLQGLVRSG